MCTQIYPQRLGDIYLNVSTDGVYNTYKVWLWVCWEYDMKRIMMFKVLMSTNISTDGVYDKVWLWVCWEGQERLLRHITAACDQQTIILLNTDTEFKDDINYFYWVQPQNNTYNR